MLQCFVEHLTSGSAVLKGLAKSSSVYCSDCKHTNANWSHEDCTECQCCKEQSCWLVTVFKSQCRFGNISMHANGVKCAQAKALEQGRVIISMQSAKFRNTAWLNISKPYHILDGYISGRTIQTSEPHGASMCLHNIFTSQFFTL
jgi:hypothetical protein